MISTMRITAAVGAAIVVSLSGGTGVVAAPSHSLVTVTNPISGDLCTGIRFKSYFVLTSSHCVNSTGSPATVGSSAGRVVAVDDSLKLAVICAVGAAPLAQPVGFGPMPADAKPVDIVTSLTVKSTTVSKSGSTSSIVNAVGTTPCSGDSGGPALSPAGKIVGVLENVPATCGNNPEYFSVSSTDAATFLTNASSKAQLKGCNDWVETERAKKGQVN